VKENFEREPSLNPLPAADPSRFGFSRLLQNNNISGRLPPELGALPRLQTLDLSNNRFSGRVPDTLGRASTLRYL
jgi:Leucine-rich repeat (LRR) protein